MLHATVWAMSSVSIDCARDKLGWILQASATLLARQSNRSDSTQLTACSATNRRRRRAERSEVETRCRRETARRSVASLFDVDVDHISPECAPPAALASCAAARRVQDCDSRPPVLVRQAPGYLADDCQLVADARVRKLRSTDTQTLVVSRTCSSFGDRTFVAAGPQVWNSLPPNLRLCGLLYGQFIKPLKTFLFVYSEATAQCELSVTNCAEWKYSYLLTY